MRVSRNRLRRGGVYLTPLSDCAVAETAFFIRVDNGCRGAANRPDCVRRLMPDVRNAARGGDRRVGQITGMAADRDASLRAILPTHWEAFPTEPGLSRWGNCVSPPHLASVLVAIQNESDRPPAAIGTPAPCAPSCSESLPDGRCRIAARASRSIRSPHVF